MSELSRPIAYGIGPCAWSHGVSERRGSRRSRSPGSAGFAPTARIVGGFPLMIPPTRRPCSLHVQDHLVALNYRVSRLAQCRNNRPQVVGAELHIRPVEHGIRLAAKSLDDLYGQLAEHR